MHQVSLGVGGGGCGGGALGAGLGRGLIHPQGQGHRLLTDRHGVVRVNGVEELGAPRFPHFALIGHKALNC